MTIPQRSGRVRSRKNRAPVPAGHFFQRKRICGIWLFQKPEGRRRLDFQRVFAWNIADFSFRFRPRIGKMPDAGDLAVYGGSAPARE